MMMMFIAVSARDRSRQLLACTSLLPIYRPTCLRDHTCMCYVFTYAHANVVRAYVCVCLCVCMYVYTQTYTHTDTHAHTHTHTHAHTHIRTHKRALAHAGKGMATTVSTARQGERVAAGESSQNGLVFC